MSPGERFWSKSRWVGQEKVNASDDYSPERRNANAAARGEVYMSKGIQMVPSATFSSKSRIPVVLVDAGATTGRFGCVP